MTNVVFSYQNVHKISLREPIESTEHPTVYYQKKYIFYNLKQSLRKKLKGSTETKARLFWRPITGLNESASCFSPSKGGLHLSVFNNRSTTSLVGKNLARKKVKKYPRVFRVFHQRPLFVNLLFSCVRASFWSFILQ